jgi:2-oxoglutarate ferredoxin oxidoreductase subunit beta
VNRLDFMPPRSEITTDYAPGTVQDVVQHDGSTLRLRKLHADYDASDKIGALTYLGQRKAAGEIVTGLLYVNEEADGLHGLLNTVDAPLNQLGEKELVPGAAALEKFNASLR